MKARRLVTKKMRRRERREARRRKMTVEQLRRWYEQR